MKKVIFSLVAGVLVAFAVSASTGKNTECKASDCTCATHSCCSGTVCACRK